MDKRFMSVLVFAVAISGGASYILYRLISAQMSTSGDKASNQLVVAAHELQLGALIKADDLKLADWSGPVPEGSFTKSEEIVGRGVIEPIYADELVQAKRIAPKGGGAGLAATIPSGMRAVAVRVNEVVGVAGFVTPGMKVDVLIAGNPPNASGAQTGTLTKTLLQDIQVLSAGQNIQKDAEGKPVTVPVVTLLVTPEQAEALSLASNEMRIQLILRNPMDREITKTTGSAVSSLFSGVRPGAAQLQTPTTAVAVPVTRRVVAKRVQVAPPPPVVVEAPPPPPPPPPPPVAKPKPPVMVEVFHGSKRTESKFQAEGDAVESKQ